MFLRVKWADLLRYSRTTIFAMLFIIPTSILIFMSLTDNRLRDILSIVMFFSGIILGILIIVYVIFKIFESKVLKKRLDWLITQLELPEDNEILEELRLTAMNYNPKSIEKTCSICALNLEKKTPVVQCLKCEKIFHKEHFVVWLRKNDNCPNCKNLILPFD